MLSGRHQSALDALAIFLLAGRIKTIHFYVAWPWNERRNLFVCNIGVGGGGGGVNRHETMLGRRRHVKIGTIEASVRQKTV